MQKGTEEYRLHKLEIQQGVLARYRARTPAQVKADRKRLRPGGVKWCGGCKTEHKLDKFSSNISKPDGLATWCGDANTLNRQQRTKQLLERSQETIQTPGMESDQICKII